MNILFLSRLFHPHIGGVETHVLELSKELIKKGHTVTLITEGYDETLKDFQTFQGITIYRIPLWEVNQESKKFAIWEWLGRHKQLLKSADVIHVHDVVYWLFPFFYFSQKIFITYHGYEGSTSPTLSAKIQRRMGEWMARKTINVGGFMKKWYGSHPDMILYGAVRPAPKLAKTKQAIYIGRLHPDTGIMTYLTALRILKQKGIEVKLDVFGAGPQQSQAKSYVEKYRLSVHFHGATVNAGHKISAYRFAFVSRYLTILEAMSAGVPVFAVYDHPIKLDYLTCHPQSEAMTVSDDPAKLATALVKAMKPSEDQKLKTLRAQAWAVKQTWLSLTRRYLQLWQSA